MEVIIDCSWVSWLAVTGTTIAPQQLQASGLECDNGDDDVVCGSWAEVGDGDEDVTAGRMMMADAAVKVNAIV